MNTRHTESQGWTKPRNTGTLKVCNYLVLLNC